MRRHFTWRRRFTSIIGLQKCPHFFITVNKIEMHVWAHVSFASNTACALMKKTYNKYHQTNELNIGCILYLRNLRYFSNCYREEHENCKNTEVRHLPSWNSVNCNQNL